MLLVWTFGVVLRRSTDLRLAANIAYELTISAKGGCLHSERREVAGDPRV